MHTSTTPWSQSIGNLFADEGNELLDPCLAIRFAQVKGAGNELLSGKTMCVCVYIYIHSFHRYLAGKWEINQPTNQPINPASKQTSKQLNQRSNQAEKNGRSRVLC